jgi:tetratricopeptide (TPR) repeat protein
VRARKGYVASPESLRTVPLRPPDDTPAPEPAAGAATPADVAALPPPTTPPPAPPADLESAPVPTVAPAITLRPDTETRVRALADREEDTGEARPLASEGWDRYGRGDLEGAARTLGEAAGLPGAAPWVLYALGFAQFGLGQAGEAAQSWERVRRAVPEFEAVYFDLADAYLQQSDPGQAIRVLRAAESRWPADPEVLNALGTVQVHREALGDAIETFQNAIDAQPEDALAYFNLARTYELRYYKMRRFSTPTTRWMDNPADAKKALENYEAYLKLGGRYEEQARSAVERLQWVVAIK